MSNVLPLSAFLDQALVERRKKKRSKKENLIEEQKRMGNSLPSKLQEEPTTPEISCHRSNSHLGKATMIIEEELQELFKFMRDNRQGDVACIACQGLERGKKERSKKKNLMDKHGKQFAQCVAGRAHYS